MKLKKEISVTYNFPSVPLQLTIALQNQGEVSARTHALECVCTHVPLILNQIIINTQITLAVHVLVAANVQNHRVEVDYSKQAKTSR